jgi:hypothetical protein
MVDFDMLDMFIFIHCKKDFSMNGMDLPGWSKK